MGNTIHPPGCWKRDRDGPTAPSAQQAGKSWTLVLRAEHGHAGALPMFPPVPNGIPAPCSSTQTARQTLRKCGRHGRCSWRQLRNVHSLWENSPRCTLEAVHSAICTHTCAHKENVSINALLRETLTHHLPSYGSCTSKDRPGPRGWCRQVHHGGSCSWSPASVGENLATDQWGSLGGTMETSGAEQIQVSWRA